MLFQGKEEKQEREEQIPSLFSGSKLLGQLGNPANFFFFFVNFNKSYGATQASKLKTGPGFLEGLQSLPVFANFTC